MHPSLHTVTFCGVCAVRTYKIYSPDNFQVYNTLLLTTVIMLYIRSPEPIHLIPENLYPLNNTCPLFPLPRPWQTPISAWWQFWPLWCPLTYSFLLLWISDLAPLLDGKLLEGTIHLGLPLHIAAFQEHLHALGTDISSGWIDEYSTLI